MKNHGKIKDKNLAFLFLSIIFALFLFIFSPIAVLANNNADIVNSSISVSSTSIPADGSTTATISVTVQDSLKNLLAGDRITLTNTSKDSGLVINGGTVGANDFTGATDSNGKVTFTVSSRNISPGIDTFTITDISDVPPVTLGSVNILFTPSALAPNASCSDGAPGSAPQLTSAIATGSQQITLTWTQAADPVSYYLIAYGITSGKYIYGNSNVGGRGTSSYTVDNLAKGTTYYFVVRAGNGCAPGGFSKELSATTLGAVVANTPTPTQMPSAKSSNTSSQDSQPEEITPTFTPTSIPIPTLTPMPSIPTLIAGLSITKFLTYLFLCILILGGLGGFIYWKYKKETKNREKPTMNSFRAFHYKNLTFLLLSIILALFLSKAEWFNTFLLNLGTFGYLGAFTAGMLFVSTFTVATGALILFTLAKTLSPVELGIIGGLGAVCGDFIIFRFIKNNLTAELNNLYNHIDGNGYIAHFFHSKYVGWTLPVIGALIIASPFPDELGVTLMGISKMKTYQFLLLAFTLDTIGIFLVVSASLVIKP